MSTRPVRCAIYTRKSTEEGLDQAFNSLDAQREACHAYVQSQASEGWTALLEHYDDGGFSGGNMDRPALQTLLADVEARRVDVVVIYKIDRLTRTLSDFAKIVERLEKRNASFVSVTQAFNTTTSMGRLTLNVLLSFAQFERELTAERIRDKIIASRKKGIFMGGNPPLGYDIKDRKLIVNNEEAETVRFIFRRYLELPAIARLRAELDEKGIRTKAWASTRRRQMGGNYWYTGPLRHLLRNRVYVGEAVHKGTSYAGEHQAIVPRDLFDEVQKRLDANRISRHRQRTRGKLGLLTGLIFDDRGNRMSPSKSRKPDGSTYLYYISQARLQRRDPNALRPIPASAIEELVCDRLYCALGPTHLPRFATESISSGEVLPPDNPLPDLIRKFIPRIEIGIGHVVISFDADSLADELSVAFDALSEDLRSRLPPEDALEQAGGRLILKVAVRLRLKGGIKRVEGWDQTKWVAPMPRYDSVLITALALAHEWRDLIEAGRIVTLEELAAFAQKDRGEVRRILRLAFMAPDIQKSILTGRQPKSLTLRAMNDVEMSPLWSEQRAFIGAAAVAMAPE